MIMMTIDDNIMMRMMMITMMIIDKARQEMSLKKSAPIIGVCAIKEMSVR